MDGPSRQTARCGAAAPTTLTQAYYTRDLWQHHCAVDRMFAWLMLCQWVGAIVLALWTTPLTWKGLRCELHPHVWTAVVIVGLLTLFPVTLAWLRPGTLLTRQTIALGQAMTSAILIHLCYGRTETHFHIFGSLAFLALYRDWTVLATASLMVMGDHAFRGWFEPAMIYGTAESSLLRSLEHGWWIAFEDVFLIYSGLVSRREMWFTAQRQAELQLTNDTIEDEVRRRTSELQASRDRIVEQAAALQQQASELTSARDQAQEASRVKSEFLANMSHEIRTPLTAILGFTDALHEEPSLRAAPARCLEMVDTIRGSGKHLLRIINDILDLSKIEADHLELEDALLDLPGLLLDIERQFTTLAQTNGLTLRTHLLSAIPREVRGDPQRLKQILINLVGNAIKFTERGGITLNVRYQAPATTKQTDDKQSGELVIDIRDTGIGLQDAQAKKLFASFTQADASMNRRHGGTGLGLKIARQLARLMHGDVTLHWTAPGQGSCFRLSLPLFVSTSSALVQQLDHAPAPSDKAQAPAANPLLNAAILLVEDGPDNQRLISLLLRKAGAQVTVAGHGLEALHLIEEQQREGRQPDLILTDMQMPEMDGYTLARTLRERGFTRPIVALTAHAMAEDRRQCLEAGCDDYTTKPINKAQFFQILQKWLAAQPAAASC